MQGMANMTVATFVKVATKLPTWTSVLLRGDHGIGKSQLVRQVARLRSQELGAELKVVDRRLAQMTEGDMLGLPSTDGNRTRFNPPDWYVECCEEPRVLFLDELNRANTEVMQAAFQIVLDRELAGRKLHPDTLVFSAINTSAAYTVNEVDPALLDRFFVVDLMPDTQDWVKWATSTKPGTKRSYVDSLIVDFIRDNDRWLDTPKDVDPQAVCPSRRSWERVSDALRALQIEDAPDDPMFYPTCLGYVGTEASMALRGFAKTYDRTVSGKEVVDSFLTKKVQAKFKGPDGNREPTQDELNALVEKVSDYIVQKLDKLSDKQGKNVQKFMEELPDELRLTFWNHVTRAGIDKVELAKSVHQWCGKLALAVFGVPPGEAGIGVTPNIPGMFKDKE